MTSDSLSLADFEVLSFDCYGTLIDWETGLLDALEPLLAQAPERPTREQVLEAYAAAESEAEEEHPDEPYPTILSRVWSALAGQWDVAGDAEAREAFTRLVGDWPAFPDTVEALAFLKQRYKLVILSNVDRASFAVTNRRLKVEFDHIITAQDIGSYKPDPRNFAALVAAVEAMGTPRGKLLHVAQSLFHDHVPARAIGLATCWIDRRAGLEGGGATRAPGVDVSPDFTFPTMAALAEAASSAGSRTE
jgi:2-haloalkanoic acid dehalogenase type II